MEQKYTDLITRINQQLWEFAEIKFQEHRSCQLLTTLFEQEGFQVETNLADMDTAFSAR